MQNSFYSSPDFESLESRNLDYRTAFQIDRDRIIYSFAFRRLQAKTQVFFPGEYDFYRTRLTHSMEVAQIGRSISNYLKITSPLLNDSFYVDPDLVEAACLAHDLGHPPFGHAGERILNELMRPYGGFEGNAQTLRILTEIIYSRKGHRQGMKPTRSLVDAVLKYKIFYSQLDNPTNHFLYDDQKLYLDFILFESVPKDIPLEKLRSIELQIMDWADDTAYTLNDMVDGIKAGFLTTNEVGKWASDRQLSTDEHQIIEQVLNVIHEENAESVFGKKIGEFIKNCSLKEKENFLGKKTNRHRFELEIPDDTFLECKTLKRISNDLVFDSPQLKQLEYKGHYMLKRIFKAFMSNYMESKKTTLNLLPKDTENVVRQAENEIEKARILCDYIAGMTDRFAIRIYKRLFDPDFGSIVDLI